MEVVDDVILDPLESAMDSMGMMQGPMAPLKRAAFGTAIGAAVVWGVRPSAVFKKDGKTFRPFALTSGDKDATWTPWWLVAAAPGILLGVFV